MRSIAIRGTCVNYLRISSYVFDNEIIRKIIFEDAKSIPPSFNNGNVTDAGGRPIIITLQHNQNGEIGILMQTSGENQVNVITWIKAEKFISVAEIKGKNKQETKSSKIRNYKPQTLEELLALSEKDLQKVDIARMNLLCATGLPHAANIDVEKYLATLDQWAEVIKAAEQKYLPAYYRNPAKYENSLSKFKAIYMVLSIQEDLRCGYNMALVNSGIMADLRSMRLFEDSRDLFLHGMIERKQGTCSSIPVLAVALGRRCGYPLYLVTAKGHLFFRWDDGKERFNIEASSKGTDIFPDAHYYKWPHPIDEAERKREKFLELIRK